MKMKEAAVNKGKVFCDFCSQSKSSLYRYKPLITEKSLENSYCPFVLLCPSVDLSTDITDLLAVNYRVTCTCLKINNIDYIVPLSRKVSLLIVFKDFQDFFVGFFFSF